MTGAAHWPERGSPETRTAPQSFRGNQKHARDPVRLARRTIASMHAAERELQSVSLAAERRQALAAVDVGLRSLHASRIAVVVSKFADRRAALVHIADAGTRAAASQQIAMEEANELARLSIEHTAEKRRLRSSVLASLGGKHRAVRRTLRRRQRYQRAGYALQLQQLRPRVTAQRQVSRVTISRGLRSSRLPRGRA